MIGYLEEQDNKNKGYLERMDEQYHCYHQWRIKSFDNDGYRVLVDKHRPNNHFL